MISANFASIFIICLLGCTSQLASSKLNLSKADAALQAAGMNPEGLPRQTQNAIERFPIGPEQAHVQREMEFLQGLAKVWPHQACKSPSRTKIIMNLETVRDSGGISDALTLWATDMRSRITESCMFHLYDIVKADKSHADQVHWRLVDRIASKFKGPTSVSEPAECPYAYMEPLFVDYPHPYNNPKGSPSINQFLLKPLRLIHKLVGRIMREIGIDSYPMRRIIAGPSRGLYGAYLMWEKLSKHMEQDIRRFVESRAEPERKLLWKLESSISSLLFLRNNDHELSSSRLAVLARHEMSKGDLIEAMGMPEIRGDRDKVELALNRLLGRACAVGDDEETRAMLVVAGQDEKWDLPVKRSIEAVAAICHWSWRLPRSQLQGAEQ